MASSDSGYEASSDSENEASGAVQKAWKMVFKEQEAKAKTMALDGKRKHRKMPAVELTSEEMVAMVKEKAAELGEKAGRKKRKKDIALEEKSKPIMPSIPEGDETVGVDDPSKDQSRSRDKNARKVIQNGDHTMTNIWCKGAWEKFSVCLCGEQCDACLAHHVGCSTCWGCLLQAYNI